MNNKKPLLPLLLVLTALASSGCKKSMVEAGLEPSLTDQTALVSDPAQQSLQNAIKGQIIVKLKSETYKSFNLSDKRGVSLQSLTPSLQSVLAGIGATRMEPVFADCPEFRERRHEAGLDRWMIVFFDENRPVSEAMSVLSEREEFECAEPRFRQEIRSFKTAPMTLAEADLSQRDPNVPNPMNDPMLDKQWHYHNRGEASGRTAIAGADINLFEAWKTQTGKRNVVVCVVDGGVDYTHEDLGSHVDVSRSFNFVIDKDGKTKGEHGIPVYPDPDGHGTHVAGTVGAINNNGIGVCGVAGGDGTENSGVTIISAQVFGNADENTKPSASGIVWGADHGAVISQNSWGYPWPGPASLPRVDREAIDYFIKYAGRDEKGNQLPDSPLDGGVVIFAAGNDGREFEAWPGAYEPCVAVTAMAWNFKASWFTTYGDWADIMAPGGDQDNYGISAGVLSTVPRSIVPAGYEFMQGTSMACPHVSGVAALIVSEYGGPGYTADMLKEQLLHATRPYDIQAYNVPKYKGKLGVGYLDAAVALLPNTKKGPDKPALTVSEASYYTAAFAFETVNNPNGAAEGAAAHHYRIYLSDKSDISIQELMALEPAASFGGEDKPAGTEMKGTFTGLKDDTAYSAVLVAYDNFDNGTPSEVVTFKTKLNTPPVIVSGLPEGKLTLLSISDIRFDLSVKDEEGNKWDYVISGDTKGARITRNGDALTVEIQPVMTEERDYTFRLTLEDEYGKQSEYDVTYTFVKYFEPTFIETFEQMLIGINGGAINLPLADKLSYVKALPVTFSAKSSDSRILEAAVSESSLILTPKSKGSARVSVTAGDTVREAYASFEVTVVNDTDATVMLLYPVPVTSKLNMILHPTITKANVKITSVRGELLIDKNVLPSATHLATLDVSKLAGGNYILTVTADGMKTFKTGFVKY